MSFSLELKLVAEAFPDASFVGASATNFITGISSLKNAKKGDLTFLANPKYKSEVKNTEASFVLLPNDYVDSFPKNNQVFVKTDKPSHALAKICRIIYSELFSLRLSELIRLLLFMRLQSLEIMFRSAHFVT